MPLGQKHIGSASGFIEEEILATKRSNMVNSEVGARHKDNLSRASDQAEQEEPSPH